MKNILWIPLMLLAVISLAACGDSDDEPSAPDQSEQPDDNGSDTTTPGGNGHYLVVYFSHTGTTERIANEIRSALNCDLTEIIPQIPYPSGNELYDRAHAEQDAIDAGEFPAIATDIEDFEEYDLMFVGFPIWSNRAATPVLAFLHNYADKLTNKRIALFASSGGSGITNSANEIYRLVPEAIFMNETLLNVFDRSRIAAWLDQLGAGSENKVEEETNGK